MLPCPQQWKAPAGSLSDEENEVSVFISWLPTSVQGAKGGNDLLYLGVCGSRDRGCYGLNCVPPQIPMLKL